MDLRWFNSDWRDTYFVYYPQQLEGWFLWQPWAIRISISLCAPHLLMSPACLFTSRITLRSNIFINLSQSCWHCSIRDLRSLNWDFKARTAQVKFESKSVTETEVYRNGMQNLLHKDGDFVYSSIREATCKDARLIPGMTSVVPSIFRKSGQSLAAPTISRKVSARFRMVSSWSFCCWMAWQTMHTANHHSEFQSKCSHCIQMTERSTKPSR